MKKWIKLFTAASIIITVQGCGNASSPYKAGKYETVVYHEAGKLYETIGQCATFNDGVSIWTKCDEDSSVHEVDECPNDLPAFDGVCVSYTDGVNAYEPECESICGTWLLDICTFDIGSTCSE